MSSLKVLFGKRLKQLRVRQKMTQLQLAVKTGLSREEISHIERGSHAPQFENIEKLAQELHTPVWQLFYFD